MKPAKAFSWSYSKLKNFETCPKRHWHIEIARDIKEDESEALTWGNLVHESAAKRISKGTALPPGMDTLEDWCRKIVTGGGKLLVEQKLAIKKDFSGTSWFGSDAWYRGIGDVIKIVGPVALIIDWKTGKILEDSVQLALMAQCVFSHHPDVQRVRSEFVWLKEGPNVSSREDFAREDMAGLWRILFPRIDHLHKAAETQSYPAKPGRLCQKWCPVSVCPHHGERH